MKKVLKRTLAIFLAVVMTVGTVPLSGFVGLQLPDIGSLVAWAEDATSGACGDNVIWSFDKTTGILTISGTGNMTDYGSYYTNPWYSFRSEVKTLIVDEGVTSIGSHTFSGFVNLKSVSIPDSMVSIGESAFDINSNYNNSYWENGVSHS